MNPCGIPGLLLAQMVKRKEISPLEVLQAAADAIREKNPAINAVVSLRIPEAMNEAKELEKRILRGEDPGILSGVPILVKDLEHVSGMKTTYGSTAFKDNLASKDSIQVTRLKANGALILGKTNTPEFGFTGFTKNRLFGVTRNPWDPSKTPGGSSGGSAAAVTAGMAPIATGSDAGGSIRIPASYCGCVGLKPTFGRIPLGPDFMGFGGGIWTLGPLCRYVEDAWAFLKATAGFHPLDPHSGLAEMNLEDEPGEPKERLRILYSRDLGRFPVEKRVVERVEDVVRKLEGFGHRVYELAQELPDLERAWWTYMAMDLAFQLKRELEEKRAQLNRAMVKAIEEVLGLRIRDLEDVRVVRAEFYLRIQGLFEMADILITPTTPTAAFAAEGPPPESIEGKAVRLLDVVAFTYPFNLTGHPAMNIRAGLTEEGLPVGLQLVAPLMREDLLLRLGFELQEGLGLHTLWPN